MAVNDSRSMNVDFQQGGVDNTYIQLAPNRGGIVENPPIDRLDWPRYGNAERFIDHSHFEAAVIQATKPVEHLRGGNTGDPRY